MFQMLILFSEDNKTKLDVTLCSTLFHFINCSTCFRQFHAHHQELTTEWCDRRVWYSAVAAESCQNQLAGSMSILGFANWFWQPSAAMALYHTRRSHHSVVSSWWWAWNCPKHVEQFIKWNKVLHKVTSSWFFYLHWIKMHGQPHIKVDSIIFFIRKTQSKIHLIITVLVINNSKIVVCVVLINYVCN